MSLLDFSSKELVDTLKTVFSNDESQTRWVIIGFEGGKSIKIEKVKVIETGNEYDDFIDEFFNITTEIYYGCGSGCQKYHCGKFPKYTTEVEKMLGGKIHLNIKNVNEVEVETEEMVIKKLKKCASSLYYEHTV